MAQALIVIDVQAGMFADAEQPYDGAGVVERIADLIDRARVAEVYVVFVQHDGGPGSALARGEPGHALHARLVPHFDDLRIVKQFSSAFHGTQLDAWLKARAIDRLTICGMQSEYCIDSAIRGAAERGYAVTLASDAHTTFDTPVLDGERIIALENQTLQGSFARVLPASAISFS